MDWRRNTPPIFIVSNLFAYDDDHHHITPRQFTDKSHKCPFASLYSTAEGDTQMPLAVIKFIDPRTGGEYPDQGLPGQPEYPDQGLPSGSPGAPDQSLPGHSGHPSHPIYSLPPRPWPPIHWPPRPWPPLPWPPRPWPPTPVDPDWGLDAGLAPGQPIYLPIGPDQGLPNPLPPVAGHLPANPPTPGTIWPPLPPSVPAGTAAVLVWIIGVGWRYTVIEVPPPEASQNPVPTPSPTK
jgi:hypothetical protein